MSLPPDYRHEISSLDREVLKQNPSDLLQFCADHFQRRLASQRAESLISQQYSTGNAGFSMTENTFSNNPFGSSTNNNSANNNNDRSASNAAASMSRLQEEDENETLASPTTAGFGAQTKIDSAVHSATSAAFGNFGFGSGSASGSGPSSWAPGPPQAASSGASKDAQSFPTNYNMNRRTSVSAESLAPSTNDDSWTPPRYPKTAEQESRLRSAVARNFLFTHLDDEQNAQVLGALQERKIPVKDVSVIAQGDVGDYFYVVESGSFDIYVSSTGKREPGPDGAGTKVGSSPAGSSFGELALMYNAPRAASVVSAGPAILWQLDRITFRRILMDSAFQRRRMYETFLDSVPLLSALTPYERSKVADALETVKYPANTEIIREGDVGAHFYILESGEAAVFKRGDDNKLKTYKKGDYFGELALLDDKPRAASVISETEVKVATLGKDGFQRLLGPVEAVMRRDDPTKRSGSDSHDPRF